MNKFFYVSSLLVLLLSGCASERVILLPNADGSSSALIVKDKCGEVKLDKPFAAVARRGGGNSAYEATADEVKERFSEALAAKPKQPISYTVYFKLGSDVLTEESQKLFVEVREIIAGYSAVEVMVIGHTDRVGSVQNNDMLSRKRAETIRDLLIQSGVPAEKLEVAGRGEREPLVQTEDEVDEPRNRRVEISLR